VLTKRVIAALAAAATAVSMATVATLAVGADSAGAVSTKQTSLVGTVPLAGTPNIGDGSVQAFTQVGSQGLRRRQLHLGDPGRLDHRGDQDLPARRRRRPPARWTPGSRPPSTARSTRCCPGPTPNTVYVGGAFNNVNGTKFKGIALLDTNTGALVPGFKFPPMNGVVNDIALSGGRLFLGGTFTTLGPNSRPGLGSLNPTTGAVDAYMTIAVAGHHNYPHFDASGNPIGAQAPVGVTKLDITPDGSRMVIIGNFLTASGLDRDQVALINLGATSATVDPNWQTARYTPDCGWRAYDSYIRDVDFSPDGTYFVIVATGGPSAGTLCDTAARWETGATGTGLQPTWVDFTGGDTLLSVAVTGAVVYVGGHERWLNNSLGSDRAQAGAVPRPGHGGPRSRQRRAVLLEPGAQPARRRRVRGLRDADRAVGRQRHRLDRQLHLQAREDGVLPAGRRQRDPGQLHRPAAEQRDHRLADRRDHDGDLPPVRRDHGRGEHDAAEQRAGLEHRARRGHGRRQGVLRPATDSNLYWRTFDGTTFGPANLINPYQDPAWSTVDTGSGQTYQGVKSNFYAEIPNVTSMFFSGGRIYYTTSTSTSLFYRYFTPESGIVGADKFTVAGTTNWSDTGGAFLDGTNLYLTSRSTGNLRRISWVNGVPGDDLDHGQRPGVDGKDWRGKAVFLSTVSANVPPTAAFTASCGGLSCTVDAGASTDSDGSIASYAWDFGDGTNGSGATASHTYAAAGTYTITLTVTDNRGGTATTTRPVTVSVPTTAIAFRGAANSNANGTTSTVTVPAAVQAGDGLVLTATVNADTVTVSDPAGWTRINRTSTTGIQTVVWSKVATAADASGAVSVTLGGTVKTSLTVAAWSGTSATTPVASVTGAVDTTATTAHTTPTATVATPGSWVLSYWADKSSSTTAWTAPAGQSVRNVSIGASSGRITSLLTDGGGVAPPGAAGGLTATTDLAGTKATMLTVVLNPAS
jgi:PKD repeat protein